MRISIVVIAGVTALVLFSCAMPGSTPQGPIDLTPGTISSAPTSVARGAKFGLTIPIQNLDSGSFSGSFEITFHETTTTPFNPSNVSTNPSVGTYMVSGIGGSTTVNETVPVSLTMPSTGSNTALYIYAVVDPTGATGDVNTANNTSTPSQAAVVLAYNQPSPQSYPVMIQTYAVTGGSATIGIVLYKDNGNGTVSYQNSDFMDTYGHLDYTTSGLGSGTYYVAVVPTGTGAGGGAGPYAINVGTINIPQTSFTALSADPDTSNDATTQNGMTVPPSTYSSYKTPVPTIAKPIGVGQSLNWYMSSTDTTEWFTFTLP